MIIKICSISRYYVNPVIKPTMRFSLIKFCWLTSLATLKVSNLIQNSFYRNYIFVEKFVEQVKQLLIFFMKF